MLRIDVIPAAGRDDQASVNPLTTFGVNGLLIERSHCYWVLKNFKNLLNLTVQKLDLFGKKSKLKKN